MGTDSAEVAVTILGLTDTQWLETAIAAGIALGAVVVALLLAAGATTIVRRFGAAEGQLDDAIGSAIRRPFILLAAVAGIAGGLGTLSYIEDDAGWISRIALAAMVLIVAVAIRRVLLILVDWQAERPGGGGRLHPGSLPLIRRGTTLLIFAAAVLIMLDTLGLAISPLLAGLGIGGLAVALALQPLLANVFASSYMLSDSSIRIGDWIEVVGGPVGSVDDIGWRATRIRSFDNNIVIVPNSVLADSTVTNYSLTSLEADSRVTVGVAYEEDLAHVERVCLDVLETLQDEWESAVKDYVPVVSFLAFGDSTVDILLKLRARTWDDSFGLRHELIKRIHARFGAEGITIYPVRRLVLQPDAVEEFARLPQRPGDS